MKIELILKKYKNYEKYIIKEVHFKCKIICLNTFFHNIPDTDHF